jgi:hypothetical protein
MDVPISGWRVFIYSRAISAKQQPNHTTREQQVENTTDVVAVAPKSSVAFKNGAKHGGEGACKSVHHSFPPLPPSCLGVDQQRLLLQMRSCIAQQTLVTEVQFAKQKTTSPQPSLCHVSCHASPHFATCRSSHTRLDAMRRYSFTKIFPPGTSQRDVFYDAALPLLQDVLLGKSALMFTYGVTNAGKTFTVQVRCAGIFVVSAQRPTTLLAAISFSASLVLHLLPLFASTM